MVKNVKKRRKNKRVNEAEKTRERYKKAGLPGSFGSASKLSKLLGKATQNHLLEEPAYTLHRPVRYKFRRRKVIVSGPYDQFQVDLVDVSNYASENKDVRFLLCCIDVFSKYAWVRALKRKSANVVSEAFENILNSSDMNRLPIFVQSDKGSEFRGKSFQKLLKDKKIKFFTSENDDIKAQICERFQRTLQTMIHRHMTATRSSKYLETLPLLVKTYNATEHRSIGMAPRDVSFENSETIWNRIYNLDKDRGKGIKESTQRLEKGATVRMSKTRAVFDRGYSGKWSIQIYVIHKILKTTPTTYKLKDQAGESIDGSFYHEELQKVKAPLYYEIEDIIDSRKNSSGKTEYLIKWLGYSPSFNSWESDVI